MEPMDARPVFANRYEAMLWKKVNRDLDDGPTQKQQEGFVSLLGSVIKKGEAQPSPVLARLIEDTLIYNIENHQEAIEIMVGMSRPQDCRPAISAARIFLESNDPDTAEALLNEVEERGRSSEWLCMSAEVCLELGKRDLAQERLLRAYGLDHNDDRMYSLLERLSPNGEWGIRHNISKVLTGKKPQPIPAKFKDTSMGRLYEIYHQWFLGSQNKATRLMVESEEYQRRHPEFVLASARMSLHEGDVSSAQKMYDLLLKKEKGLHISCEAAESFSIGGNHNQALRCYKNAEMDHPDDPRILKGLSKTLFNLGLMEESKEYTKRLLDDETADLDTYIEMVSILILGEEYPLAKEYINRVLMTYPDDGAINVLKSEVELKCGNASTALFTINRTMRRNPDNLRCVLQKSRILFHMGRIKGVEKELINAEKTHPDNLDILLMMREIAEYDRNDAKLDEICKKIMELDPDNEIAGSYLSHKRLISEMDSEPYSSFRAMVVKGSPESFIDVLMELVRKGRYDDAVKLCEDKDEYDGIPLGIQLKGNAEYALGRYEESSESYKKALRMDPSNHMLWYSLGMSEERKGDLDAAESSYNRAILLKVDSPELWLSKASVQESKENLVGAIESLNQILNLDPDNVFALVKKANILKRVERFDEALYIIDIAIPICPDDIRLYKIKRNICEAFGRYNQILDLTEAIYEMDPNNESNDIESAKMFSRMELPDEAVKVLERALKRNPDSIPVLNAMKSVFLVAGDAPKFESTNGKIKELVPSEAPAPKVVQKEKDQDVNFRPEPRIQVPVAVKRNSERVLRRTYLSNTSIRDLDMANLLGLDEKESKTIVDYLADIEPYGIIDIESSKYERMEKLSMHMMISGNIKEIDLDPMVSLPSAYVAGGCKDADEAKQLMAFVAKVLDSKTDGTVLNNRDLDLGSVNGDMPLTEIMRRLHVGLYTAKAVKDALNSR